MPKTAGSNTKGQRKNMFDDVYSSHDWMKVEQRSKLKIENTIRNPRTMRLRVAEVIGRNGQVLKRKTGRDELKNAFYADLRHTLNLARCVKNKAITLIFEKDKKNIMHPFSENANKKLPPLELPYKAFPYHELANLFPGNTSIAANIARSAQKLYKSHRWGIIVNGDTRLPINERFAVPLPHNTGSISLELIVRKHPDDQNIYARIKLNKGWWMVKLRSGSNYSWPVGTTIKAIKEGGQRILDSSIWTDKKDNVATIGIAVHRSPSNYNYGNNKKMCVRTSRDCLLSLTIDKNEIPFNLNCDQIFRWYKEKERKQQRLRQDRKSGQLRKYVKKQQGFVSNKYANRINDFLHTTSKQVVVKAVRAKVGVLEYDDTVKSYFKSFRWYDLSEMIASKCKDKGIEFRRINEELNSIDPVDITAPHAYFALRINGDGKVDKYVKIGSTSNPAINRLEQMSGSHSGFHYVYLAAHQASSKADAERKEKHWLAYFKSVKNQKKKFRELFLAGPVIEYLRNANALGNVGNKTELKQYIDMDDLPEGEDHPKQTNSKRCLVV